MVLGADAVPELAAQKIEQRLRTTWGGQQPYVRRQETPKTDKGTLIRSEFNGRNRRELQEKYGVSKAQFYRFLKGT